jgi:hypothetical protein
LFTTPEFPSEENPSTAMAVCDKLETIRLLASTAHTLSRGSPIVSGRHGRACNRAQERVEWRTEARRFTPKAFGAGSAVVTGLIELGVWWTLIRHGEFFGRIFSKGLDEQL